MSQDPSYIRVAVCAPVHETFTYAVPEALRPALRVGCRVLVPFGPRRVTGYVLAREAAPPGLELKSILAVMDARPLFPATMAPFFEWLARYYRYPVGQAIADCLPANFKPRIQVHGTLTPEGHEALRHLPADAPERGALEWLRDHPGEGPNWPAPVWAALEQAGWVAHAAHWTRKGKDPTVRTLVRWTGTAEFLEAVRGDALGFKTAQERELLLRVAAAEVLPRQDLHRDYPRGAYLVSKWVRKGALTCLQGTVFRNPAGETLCAPPAPAALSAQQAEAVAALGRELEAGRRFAPFLLFGVTGSGKTEVYLRAAQKAVAQGRQVLVLVPEIALAVYMEGIYRTRLSGCRLALYHSGRSAGEREALWQQMSQGLIDVVVGARSALFAPVPDLGLIIVDEEHDTGYKQEGNLKYHARDAAVVRAQMEKALVVLGSGTPSVQSFENALSGKYRLLRMPERVERRPLPAVRLVDLAAPEFRAARGRIISPPLGRAITANLKAGNQTLLFLNRRGYHRLYWCPQCRQALRCPQCDVALTYHKSEDSLVCHYCGFTQKGRARCGGCGSTQLRVLALGTEHLEEEIRQHFPQARVGRLDADIARRKGEAFRILKCFRNAELDILVGTQMITKGYDFPGITLVGVLDADLGLALPDFRAAERSFQLLAQVAGRAGRGAKPGEVFIQCVNPEHYAIRTAVNQDFQGFFDREKDLRALLNYPPFGHLASLRLSGREAGPTAEAAEGLGQALRDAVRDRSAFRGRIQVLGPAKAVIARLNGRHRWQILLKSLRPGVLQQFVAELESEARQCLRPFGTQLVIDRDPYHML